MFGKLKSFFSKRDELSESDMMNAFLADSLNTGTRSEPISDDDLGVLCSSFESWYRNVPGNAGDVPICTCVGCSDNRTCTLAFDVYNTDGDCLRDT